ncbi:putative splicing factor 3A subunit 1 [Raphanus sativus]|nr:putative splicing factor 3A subunit 1 [Raphanus sativus]
MAENEIVQPPEDIATKTIVEKTASFVSKYENGPVFEKDLRDSQANDPSLDFLKELDTIKVTAQFSVWYGHYFVWALRNHMTQLEFLSPKHSWNAFYKECKQGFEKVLKPPKDSREKLYKSADYTGAVQQGFKQRIQQDDPVKERKWLEQGERAMIDWHDSVSKPFAIEEVQELPPQGPDAKRQKLDDWVLVPENQFLAQHPRIAQVIEIPAVKYKLSGKSGVLEDDKKSLAHYNVGPGDILTLSL